jgi:CRP-like cAMP-binding protein
LLKVLSFIYIQKAQQGSYLIDEGAEGDRFYVSLKGELGVEKATEKRVEQYKPEMAFKKLIWYYL